MFPTDGDDFQSDAVIVNSVNGKKSIRVAGEAFGAPHPDRRVGARRPPLAAIREQVMLVFVCAPRTTGRRFPGVILFRHLKCRRLSGKRYASLPLQN
jgi:hypothetical protein